MKGTYIVTFFHFPLFQPQVVWEQPDYMWQYQLKYERDVVAQREAIFALERYPTPSTRLALTDTIENEHCFYKVRTQACSCLTKVANFMVATWQGPPAMMAIFRKMFGSHSCPAIIRQNNFTNFQHYFILKVSGIGGFSSFFSFFFTLPSRSSYTDRLKIV